MTSTITNQHIIVATKPALYAIAAPYAINGVLPVVRIVFETGPATATGWHSPEHDSSSLFALGQNYPNPHLGQTTVPFSLAKAADVALGIFDLTGRKVAGVVRKGLHGGEHSIALNLTGLGLPTGNYVYQLQISNGHGVHRQQKTMTAG